MCDGWSEKRVALTRDQLDALPDETLLRASGRYPGGSGTFTDCWVRPVPAYVTGTTEPRLWEVLIYGGDFRMISTENIDMPAVVLWAPCCDHQCAMCGTTWTEDGVPS